MCLFNTQNHCHVILGGTCEENKRKRFRVQRGCIIIFDSHDDVYFYLSKIYVNIKGAE
jgi:hypothetical protein